MHSKFKVALVHDWLTDFGGAERVLLAFHELFPDAPIFTTFFRPENLPMFADADIRTSYLQKIPFARKHHRLFFPMMPAAVESWDFGEFDLVISDSSSGCAKGIVTKPETLHICYCHNPNRALWDGAHEYLRLHEKNFNFLARKMIPRQLMKMRIWDRVAADRVDYFLANSEFVAKRIQKYYQREATVIHPPVETKQFVPSEKKPANYFLAVGRLIPYKRFDLAIQAANVLGVKLRIVGIGPEEKRLRAMAGPTVTFFGKVSEETLRRMYSECRALIFPQVEDFGLTAVEVQASGRPVIAFHGGGALETIRQNQTGIFFNQQTVSSLADAMQRAIRKRWVKKSIVKNAERFDTDKFKKRILEFVEEKLEEIYTASQ
ncbi:MAG: glycosyltransferase [Patescibacteria group bacterium]